MKKLLSTVIFLLAFSNVYAKVSSPKHEFRGVWISTIYQNQYQTMGKAKMQAYFREMLDRFHQAGINAFIFQVRSQADAFYKSSFEPYSKYFTGSLGQAPDEDWDPMSFLIEECHNRNIEFHAWLNPYRVTTSTNEVLPQDHLVFQNPEWFVKYNGKVYFNPGVPACRAHICKIVKDIVSRYDVDAIHMDDYFYPYPVAGIEFPDRETFETFGAQQGFQSSQLADWRRNNVNLLVGEIKETIFTTKRWVRFGISPFGIYANKKSMKGGSDTNGLENYNDLYADVLFWTQRAYIDYVVPQLYWEIGNPRADYLTLLKWWAANDGVEHLYIGESVVRTMNAMDMNRKAFNQLSTKMKLVRSNRNIDGQIFWNGYDLLQNVGGVMDSLKSNFYKYPALPPMYEHMGGMRPAKVAFVKIEKGDMNDRLTWSVKIEKEKDSEGIYFCVYRFKRGELRDYSNPKNIFRVTRLQWVDLPKGNAKYDYVVTAFNRYNQESKSSKKIRY